MIKIEDHFLVATNHEQETRLYGKKGYGSAQGFSHNKEYDKFENTPMTGFKILTDFDHRQLTLRPDTVMVLDPRGFIIRCNMATIINLMQEATIINGEIVDKCLWGRSSVVPILIKENGPTFNAIHRKEEYIPVERLKVGAHYRIDNKRFEYLGYKYLSFVDVRQDEEQIYVHDKHPAFCQITGKTYFRYADRVNFMDKPKIIEEMDLVDVGTGMYLTSVKTDNGHMSYINNIVLHDVKPKKVEKLLTLAEWVKIPKAYKVGTLFYDPYFDITHLIDTDASFTYNEEIRMQCRSHSGIIETVDDFYKVNAYGRYKLLDLSANLTAKCTVLEVQ